MYNFFFDRTQNQPALFLGVVFGRFPLWLLVLLFLLGNLNALTFIGLYILLLAARAYLIWYETGLGMPGAAISTLWRNFFRIIFWFIFIEMALIGVLYTFAAGERLDYALFMLAFGCFIPIIAINMFSKKAAESRKPALIRFGVVALWIFAFAAQDYMLFRYAAVVLAYIMEFSMFYKPAAALAEKGTAR